MAEYNITGHY